MTLLLADDRLTTEEFPAADLADDLDAEPTPRAHTATEAATRGCPQSVQFPAHGWQEAALAWSMLSPEVQQQIRDAADQGEESITVALAAPVGRTNPPVTQQPYRKPIQAVDAEPVEPLDTTPSPVPFAAFDDANMPEESDVYLPSSSEIEATTAEIRAGWTPVELRAAEGYRAKWRAPRARFGFGTSCDGE